MKRSNSINLKSFLLRQANEKIRFNSLEKMENLLLKEKYDQDYELDLKEKKENTERVISIIKSLKLIK